MIFWIFAVIWILNKFVLSYANKIREDWIEQQNWLIEQHKTLRKHPDFNDEASQALKIAYQINRWTDESIRLGAPLSYGTQMLILVSVFLVIIFGTIYIPIVVAAAEAGTIVYGWIMWRRWHKSRGMCYGVQANVDAITFYSKHTESDHDSESDSTDSR